jgi:hypothetical protein
MGAGYNNQLNQQSTRHIPSNRREPAINNTGQESARLLQTRETRKRPAEQTPGQLSDWSIRDSLAVVGRGREEASASGGELDGEEMGDMQGRDKLLAYLSKALHAQLDITNDQPRSDQGSCLSAVATASHRDIVSSLEDGAMDSDDEEQSEGSAESPGPPSLDSRTMSVDSLSDWSLEMISDNEVEFLQEDERQMHSTPGCATQREQTLFSEITETYLGTRLSISNIREQSKIMRP